MIAPSNSSWSTGMICGFLVMAFSANCSAFSLNRREAREQEQIRQTEIYLTEMLFDDALRALDDGKAIVVFPVYGNRKYFESDRTIGNFTDYTLDLTFEHESGGEGAERRFTSARSNGRDLMLGDPSQMYAFHIVDPGKWSVSSVRIDIRDVEPPEVKAQSEMDDLGVGVVEFEAAYYTDRESYRVWNEPEYEQRTVVTHEGGACVAVSITGACIAISLPTSEQVTVVAKEGSWGTRVASENRAALIVRARTSRPFAEFSVAKGEIVVLDSLVFTAPGLGNAADCVRDSEFKTRCPMTGFEYQVVPADISAFSEAMSDGVGEGYLRMIEKPAPIGPQSAFRERMKQARYLPYTLAGRPIGQSPNRGQTMRVVGDPR